MNTHGMGRQWTMESGPRKKAFLHKAVLPIAMVYCLLSPLAVYAISKNSGTSNGAFLKIATDARGVALGPAMVSMASGTEALRWNPAALGMVDAQELAATHIEYYQDVSIENVSFAYPLEQSGIGASVFYLGAGDLEGRDDVGLKTGDFTFYDAVGTVGYGRQLRSREESGMDIYLGGSLKLIQEKIADTSYQNPAFDLGVTVIPTDNLRTAVTFRNISFGKKADFPKELTGGLSYTMFRMFTGGAAVKYSDDAPVRLGISGEYKIPELENSVIRLGYQTHDDLDDSTDAKIEVFRNASWTGVTMGAGMEIRPPTLKTLYFLIDYAMAPFGALGISHTVTLKLRW